MLKLCDSVFLKTLVAPNATALKVWMKSFIVSEHLPL